MMQSNVFGPGLADLRLAVQKRGWSVVSWAANQHDSIVFTLARPDGDEHWLATLPRAEGELKEKQADEFDDAGQVGVPRNNRSQREWSDLSGR